MRVERVRDFHKKKSNKNNNKEDDLVKLMPKTPKMPK